MTLSLKTFGILLLCTVYTRTDPLRVVEKTLSDDNYRPAKTPLEVDIKNVEELAVDKQRNRPFLCHLKTVGIGPRKLWTDFHVCLDDIVNATQFLLVAEAIETLSTVLPCVNFHLHPPGAEYPGDHVYIMPGNNCSSLLGRIGGRQNLYLSNDCWNNASITHELIHALGGTHEQCRQDRDLYVTILWPNVEPSELENFEMCNAEYGNSFGVPYNYKSIMHYPSYLFSRNKLPTIVKKNGGIIGRNVELHEFDKLKLQRMYNCTEE